MLLKLESISFGSDPNRTRRNRRHPLNIPPLSWLVYSRLRAYKSARRPRFLSPRRCFVGSFLPLPAIPAICSHRCPIRDLRSLPCATTSSKQRLRYRPLPYSLAQYILFWSKILPFHDFSPFYTVGPVMRVEFWTFCGGITRSGISSSIWWLYFDLGVLFAFVFVGDAVSSIPRQKFIFFHWSVCFCAIDHVPGVEFMTFWATLLAPDFRRHFFSLFVFLDDWMC